MSNWLPQILMMLWLGFQCGIAIKMEIDKDDHPALGICISIILVAIQCGLLYWGGFFS